MYGTYIYTQTMKGLDMNLLGAYKNGNVNVVICEDGTKFRWCADGIPVPEKPESIDLKITNKCYGNGGGLCGMCHENSCPSGKHGDIMNLAFIDTMLPYSEIAIGGGDPILHPDLIPFLMKLKKLKIIPNMTVNQHTFTENYCFIESLIADELVYGLGVSLNDPTDEFIRDVKELPNAVVHVINGIVTVEQLRKLANADIRLLILGYKEFRRGQALYAENKGAIEERKLELYNAMSDIVDNNWFSVISFDNLALKQLNMRDRMTDEEWEVHYQGIEGSHTMFVDAVNGEFAVNSTSTKRWDVEDDIKVMFDKVRCEINGEI